MSQKQPLRNSSFLLMTISDLQHTFLSHAHIAPEDFFVLLSHITKQTKTFLIAHPEHILSKEESILAQHILTRRLSHEPVAYLTGTKEFFGFTLAVTSDTLIPRPETEQIVECVLHDLSSEHYSVHHPVFLADIGTGSGAIILALAKTLAQKLGDGTNVRDIYTMHATDISSAALDVARRNAHTLHIDTLVSFHEGNLLEPLMPLLNNTDDIILTANLPYLSPLLYESTPDTVKYFEPQSALLSPHDGLDHYRILFQQLANIITPTQHLRLYCEISPEQDMLIENETKRFFPQAKTHILHDLSDKSRVFYLELSSLSH